MQKLFLLTIVSFFLCMKNYGQDTAAVNKGTTGTAITDTAVINDLMGLLDSTDAPNSYFSANIGLGNKLFSTRNNSINSRQATTSTIIFSPSLGYFHKSGLSLTAGANLLNDGKKGFGVNQYSLTPAFDLLNNKNIGFGISYSHYFVEDKFSIYSSPIQNDLYTYFNYKKWWLEPGIALGFSSGKFTEVTKYTTLLGNVLVDTGTFKLKSFSLLPSVSHSFEWYGIFGKNDGIVFIPSLQGNFSSDSTQTISHTIKRNLIRSFNLKRRVPKLQGKNKFEAQSLGLNLDLSYTTGNFSIQPQLYLDYYLPATDQKRFTSVFTLNIGYSF